MSTRRQRERRRLEKIAYMKALYDAREAKNKPLEDMTKQELITYASEHDVEVDKYAKKGEILEAIRAVIE